ncbi:MAG TPA: hypothetical protein DF292_12085 [Firmicutes bacterium]|jgi:hypothetical protein|nr:hypothetical protein [Bacillota bacterium]
MDDLFSANSDGQYYRPGVDVCFQNSCGKEIGETFAVFSGLAGAASSAVKTLVHHVFEWLNIAEPIYTQINAFLIHGHATVRGVSDIFMTESVIWLLVLSGELP